MSLQYPVDEVPLICARYLLCGHGDACAVLGRAAPIAFVIQLYADTGGRLTFSGVERDSFPHFGILHCRFEYMF